MLSEEANTLLKCNLQATFVNFPYGRHLKDILEEEGSGCISVCSQVCAHLWRASVCLLVGESQYIGLYDVHE